MNDPSTDKQSTNRQHPPSVSNPPSLLKSRILEARDCIHAKRFLQPSVAIVLGSGLGDLADQVQHPSSIAYDEIPGFQRTHAAGHAGKLVLGFLSGVPVVAMQGRCHRYEGFANHQAQFPIHCMNALGASTLVTTNAAGGLNTRFRQGDLMAIDSHIDYLWPRRMWEGAEFGQDNYAPRTARGANPYRFELIDEARRIARSQDAVLHQGTYLATLGPTYETRGEYRMFRKLGADAVGMSTVPEVLAAQRLGMQVLAISVITNVASTDMPATTTHAEVVDSGITAGPKLMRILSRMFENWAGQPD